MYTSPSGKSYIGQTWNEKQRKQSHRAFNGHCTHFHNAIKKYGYSSFEYIVLHNGLNDQKTMDELEYMEIMTRKTLNPDGYNLRIGGSKGKSSDLTRKRQSESLKGRKATNELRKKLSEAHKGKYPSEETRLKMSISGLGKVMSKETREKLSIANKKSRTPETTEMLRRLCGRSVVCVETGEVYFSIGEAAIRKCCSKTGIWRSCNSEHGRSGGYHWRYNNAKLLV